MRVISVVVASEEIFGVVEAVVFSRLLMWVKECSTCFEYAVSWEVSASEQLPMLRLSLNLFFDQASVLAQVWA